MNPTLVISERIDGTLVSVYRGETLYAAEIGNRLIWILRERPNQASLGVMVAMHRQAIAGAERRN